MKIEKCKNRFEVIAGDLDDEAAQKLIEEFEEWVFAKQYPTEEDYMAALGPCGK